MISFWCRFILTSVIYLNLDPAKGESEIPYLNSTTPKSENLPIYPVKIPLLESEEGTDGNVSSSSQLGINAFTTTATALPQTISESSSLNLEDTQISSHLYTIGKMDGCWTEAKCEPLEDNVCLGVRLPYTHTSLALSNLTSQKASHEVLKQFSAWRNIPYCWSVIQPFLCAVLFPECHNSSVQFPSQEMCAVTRGPCRLIEQERGWPDILKCRDEYLPKCKTTTRDLPFNTTGQCYPPLVSTSNDNQYFEGVRGCGVQCLDPMFTPEEHKDIQSFIATIGGICLGCSAFTVLTYLIEWRSANKYPALIIFYINVCFLISGIGFMVQFHGDVKERVTCHSDGTLRNSEPSTGGNVSCVVVFVCIYYFMIAAVLWFVILGYAWHRSFKSLAAGHWQENLERKASYFHLISWSIPLVFTIGIIASAEVKGDSTMGICFLSPSIPVRIGALLLPVTCGIFGGGTFLLSGLNTLVKMKLEYSNIISEHANKKIVETIIRLAIFTVALLVFLMLTIYSHVDLFLNQEDWKESLRRYILCTSGIINPTGDCVMVKRPHVNLYKLHLMALFGSGIIMGSWCWTKNSLETWQRFLRRVVGVSSDEPVKLSKHKIIAQAFAKRKDLNTLGRLSISLRSFHSDPLGLNFDMNSATSGEVSSVWAAAIPYLMQRRGAVSGASAFLFRRNSFDSEYGTRRISVESAMTPQRRGRCHSLDSQLSFHVSDVERFAALQTAARFGARGRKRDWFSLHRKEGRKRSQSYEHRNSNTSDDSILGSFFLPAVTLNRNDSLFTTMMKRLDSSSDKPTVSVRGNRGFHPATDSEDENLGNVILRSSEFSRKFNGFKKKGNAIENGFVKVGKEVMYGRLLGSKVVKATVGVQTSLESLTEAQHTVTEDKSCQVSTPILQRSAAQQASSTESTTSSELDPNAVRIAETKFISARKYGEFSSARRSLSPPSRSFKKSNKSSAKLRCQSDNDFALNVEVVP